MLHVFKLYLKVGKITRRGSIPSGFETGVTGNARTIEDKSNNDYLTWSCMRYITQQHLPEYSNCKETGVPSFTAFNSLLVETSYQLTNIAFTPIIPYPATEYDTINTCMKNFQDVLQQKQLPYGPLWCDEGVYRIAKELQLLNPIGFSNIFLGLGGFHMEKIVIACLGKFLEESGVESIFVEMRSLELSLLKVL